MLRPYTRKNERSSRRKASDRPDQAR